jgi:hypothetical protein
VRNLTSARHNRVSRSPSWPGRKPGKVNKAGLLISSTVTRRGPLAKAAADVANVAAVAADSRRVSSRRRIHINRVTRTAASGRNGRRVTDRVMVAVMAKAVRISNVTHRAVIAAGIGTERFNKNIRPKTSPPLLGRRHASGKRLNRDCFFLAAI